MYGLKEKNLAKTYIKLIPLGMKDPDAIRLLNWKRPSGKYVCISTSLTNFSSQIVFSQDLAISPTCFTKS